MRLILSREVIALSKKMNLEGQKYGRLTVIEEAERSKSGLRRWKCICECGNETTAQGGHLRSGGVKSCGCYSRDISTKHGMSGTRFYSTWDNMKQRATNHNRPNASNYVARGIILCPRWQIFENFMEDMYESYLEHVEEHGEDNTTLDRTNNDTRYTPWNCRWATYEVQARNKRTSKPAEETEAGVS